jgi:LemA protein
MHKGVTGMNELILGMISTGWIILIVIVAILFFLFALYNRLVRLRIQVRNAWSQIDVQLKRRYDLIPNLIETVKGYAGHEKETLERVVLARQQAIGAQGVREQAQAENMLTQTLRQLFALGEAYPNLKANENFLHLQEELAGTENRIGFARQFYNDSVGEYNTAIQVFPAVLFAAALGFTASEFFQLEGEQERTVPKVKF